ncbi:MAG: hypothetical protein LBT12_02405 [Oscillospiraceae bacterium]|jgi:ribosomal protein S1|nr:hypothetical protein [Oscillospiraceae bacterium]
MEFSELNLRELDRELNAAELEEWNGIYSSFRGGSVVSGTVIGVDFHKFDVKGKREKAEVACLVAIKNRVKIIIPEPEVWMTPTGRIYMLRSMRGGAVDYVVTHIDRENGFAVASRKQALSELRFAARNQRPLGQTVAVQVLSVGRNVCTVTYNGYDVLLSQRDISYSIVPDLREVLHPGDVKNAVVTEWNPKDGVVNFSIKATMRHPFDGIDVRHPLGATRVATIIGKYAGGVFCRLFDGVTDVLCTYDALQYDGDFAMGDRVEVLVKKYNREKKLVYGKILRKMY